MMFNTMLDQLSFLYPQANIHVLTNENEKNFGKIVWHFRPNLEENHGAKLELYGLIDKPAMYIDNDILLIQPFRKRHLKTKHPFNVFQASYKPLQIYTRRTMPFAPKRQYNCGLIWIARPSRLIVEELLNIKEQYFGDREWIESNKAWFNNDEHPVSYFVAKYEMTMRLFKTVNVFRREIKYKDIFNVQSIHYTGLKYKEVFVKEYKELCQARVRIFS